MNNYMIIDDCLHSLLIDSVDWLNCAKLGWSMILDALTESQRKKAEDEGYDSLSKFDLTAILYITKYNLNAIQKQRIDEYPDSDWCFKMSENNKKLVCIRNKIAHRNAEELSDAKAIAYLYHIKKFYELTSYRLIFGVYFDNYGSRYYIFHGIFKLDDDSTNDIRIWNKISDTFSF